MTVATNTKKLKLNKIEKVKQAKDGLDVKQELEKFAEIGWEALEEGDLIVRLKWLGIFHRPVTPGKFMLRLRTPNGILSSERLRTFAEIIQRYGDDGNLIRSCRQTRSWACRSSSPV